MSEQFESEVIVTDSQGNIHILLDGNGSRVFIRGASKIVLNGDLGTLSLFDNNDNPSADVPFDWPIIRASAEDSTIVLRGGRAQRQETIKLQGAEGTITIGGFSADGDLGLFSPDVFSNPNDLSAARIHASASGSFIQLRNANRENTIFIGGENSTMLLGDTLKLNGDNGRITKSDSR